MELDKSLLSIEDLMGAALMLTSYASVLHSESKSAIEVLLMAGKLNNEARRLITNEIEG